MLGGRHLRSVHPTRGHIHSRIRRLWRLLRASRRRFPRLLGIRLPCNNPPLTECRLSPLIRNPQVFLPLPSRFVRLGFRVVWDSAFDHGQDEIALARPSSDLHKRFKLFRRGKGELAEPVSVTRSLLMPTPT